MSDEDMPVYFDRKLNKCYWIEWEETGNNDIPHRHYIGEDTASVTKSPKTAIRLPNVIVRNISQERPIIINGLIKIDSKAEKYKIPAGLYPVIYFEPNAVQIPIVLNDEQPDFMWIDRNDIDQWIQDGIII